jgi:hypothetical protein
MTASAVSTEQQTVELRAMKITWIEADKRDPRVTTVERLAAAVR